MKNALLNGILTVACCVPVFEQDPDLEPGLVGEYFALAAAPDGFPNLATGVKPTFVRVDKAGKTTFWTQSDDGSRLVLDGKVVVDNGGDHPMTEKSGSAELTAGDH